MTLNVCVGYDPREWEAYLVTCDSLRRTSSQPVNIIPIDERDLRKRGFYSRPYRVDEAGQFWDDRDMRPFSVAFSFTRFLVPWIAPKGPVLFVDCDFVFKRDVAELFDLHDWGKAVQVVKHFHTPEMHLKMDGVQQAAYPRKNWSSCVLWNTLHPAHERLTPHDVNHRAGRWLHGFDWLRDNEIGGLPEEWNWLAGISPTTGGGEKEPAAIHYTEGGPWFSHMHDCPFAADWVAAQNAMQNVAPAVLEQKRRGRPPKVKELA